MKIAIKSLMIILLLVLNNVASKRIKRSLRTKRTKIIKLSSLFGTEQKWYTCFLDNIFINDVVNLLRMAGSHDTVTLENTQYQCNIKEAINYAKKGINQDQSLNYSELPTNDQIETDILLKAKTAIEFFNSIEYSLVLDQSFKVRFSFGKNEKLSPETEKLYYKSIQDYQNYLTHTFGLKDFKWEHYTRESMKMHLDQIDKNLEKKKKEIKEIDIAKTSKEIRELSVIEVVKTIWHSIEAAATFIGRFFWFGGSCFSLKATLKNLIVPLSLFSLTKLLVKMGLQSAKKIVKIGISVILLIKSISDIIKQGNTDETRSCAYGAIFAHIVNIAWYLFGPADVSSSSSSDIEFTEESKVIK